MRGSPGRRSDDEAALIELAQRGFRYALALTHDRGEAEDLVHEALVSILRSASPRTAPYFFTVIRSRFVDRRRREGSLVLESLEERAEAGLPEAFDVEEPPLLREELEHALGRLRGCRKTPRTPPTLCAARPMNFPAGCSTFAAEERRDERDAVRWWRAFAGSRTGAWA